MDKVTTPEQEIKELKQRINDLEINLEGAETDVNHFEHRYKKAEVWLKCFTAVIASNTHNNKAEFEADRLAQEYWSKFE